MQCNIGYSKHESGGKAKLLFDIQLLIYKKLFESQTRDFCPYKSSRVSSLIVFKMLYFENVLVLTHGPKSIPKLTTVHDPTAVNISSIYIYIYDWI